MSLLFGNNCIIVCEPSYFNEKRIQARKYYVNVIKRLE